CARPYDGYYYWYFDVW
nr:immunoglobulin heavy chain junction region [Mus musculus]MBK4188657.1 immunoglobulin heavy chain junction region [Mus musculus]MBK4188659.1 immunoglobulin heavy chain junction region [Mus musculus]